MPRFFDKNQLTPEQQSRWNWATSEYERVQKMNADASFSRMTEKQKKEAIKGSNIPTDMDLDAFVKSKLFSCSMNTPGDEKSALFARLLNGLQALASPPPTYFSYPWYQVVEGEGPFPVMVGGVGWEQAKDGKAALHDPKSIIIGQSSWRVVSLNKAAQNLFELDHQLRSTSSVRITGPGQYDKETVFNWTADFVTAVETAYKSEPEIVVQWGEWSPYRLHIGRAESTAVRHFALDVQSRAADVKVPANVGSVFDSMMLMFDVIIEETKSLGEDPTAELNRAEEALKRAQEAKSGIYFAELYLAGIKRGYDEKLDRRAKNPDCDDWVKITTLGWVLDHHRG